MCAVPVSPAQSWPGASPWKAWNAGKWSILIWFRLLASSEFPSPNSVKKRLLLHKGQFPKGSSGNGMVDVAEPWSRSGGFGVIFTESQEAATTTGTLQPQKPSLAGKPFHKTQKSKQPLKRQSVTKGKKGMQTTEVLENVKCRELGDEREILGWQINDKLLILLLLLLSC